MNNATSHAPETDNASAESDWNRFWFQPADPFPLGVLRLFVGLAATYYVASHTSDLQRWFGPNGILPHNTVLALVGGNESRDFHWSYLNLFAESATGLWIVHAVGLVITLAFALGLASRITAILSFAVVVSYAHRAPMITGPFETVLSLLLFGLCFGPCGAALSLDWWWRNRKSNGGNEAVSVPASWSANVSLRLLQIHIAALYLVMGLTKLGGRPGNEFIGPWWTGEALWWLILRDDSRLVDLTFLSSDVGILAINLLTHAIVAVELLFPILIWQKGMRRWLLIATTLSWLLLAPLTGLLSFGAILLVANLAFVPASSLRSFFARWFALSQPGPSEK